MEKNNHKSYIVSVYKLTILIAETASRQIYFSFLLFSVTQILISIILSGR